MGRFMRGEGRRGARGDGSICVVLTRESEAGRKKGQCMCLSHSSLSGTFFGVI